MVEFAAIAALVLAIVFGILEFGLIFLQEHYVASAAREAVRIGVRANTFNSYGVNARRSDCLDTVNRPSWQCTDRRWRVEREAIDYLNVFYDPGDVSVNVSFGNGALSATIAIDNENIKKSGIVPFANDINFTVSMAYEDQKEYEDEH